MSTTSNQNNMNDTESSKVASTSFYTPPDFALTPPSTVEYRLKKIDTSSSEARGWNVERRLAQSFISFGREPPVDFCISHESVSRKHAILQYCNGDSGPGWYLYDLGSAHGTFVDDEKIPAKEYVYLEDNAKVRIGYAKKFTFILISTVTEVDPNQEIQKVTYSPPGWRLQVPDELDYQLEIINNGKIEKNISLKDYLNDNNFVTIGKPEASVIIDKHPSVSRLHAVLQFGLLGKKYGWFLYDNGSSHGTKLNRAKLPPKYYAKLAIGASFTLGASKQLYCLTGPSHEDEEVFANKAITKNASSSSGNIESGESIEAKAYTADPIGWLTGYFETEGIALEYSFAPGGSQNTVCSIDLRDVLESAEDTIVKGEGRGRDEAKKNAALAACKVIDSQSQGYSKTDFRTKRQEYEENDFYSSDEDEYLDRTGQIAARRKKRQQRYDDTATQDKVLTHDDLVKQLDEAKIVLDQVTKTQEQIAEEARTTRSISAKFLLSSSRQKLLVAQTEVRRLTALVEASRPAVIQMPSKPPATETKSIPQEVNEPGKNVDIEKPSKEPSAPTLPQHASETAINEEAVEIHEDKPTTSVAQEPQKPPEPKKRSAYGLIQRKDLQEMKNEALTAKKRKVMHFEDEDFDEDMFQNRDSKTEIQPEPEDDATWLPPEGQTGDGMTKLNAKFAGRY